MKESDDGDDEVLADEKGEPRKALACSRVLFAQTKILQKSCHHVKT